MHDLVFFYPQGHQAHALPHHPERPERVEQIRSALEQAGWWGAYPQVNALTLPVQVLQSVHTPAHLVRLEAFSRQGGRIDPDTYFTPQSWVLALQAAGGAASVATSVWLKESRCGFALTRPPGHHATSNKAMGFCLLNNVALAADYLIREAGAERLAIVDLDLHHGNGTQDIFWQRGDVLFISTHQFPLYPGTGWLDEIGQGDGEGATVNLPLPPMSGDEAFLTAMETIILAHLDHFGPEMVLVSAGFDAHWRDPLGSLLLSATTYGQLIAQLTTWADGNCDGRIALFLEGGYDLEGNNACAVALVAALLRETWEDPIGPTHWRERDDWKVVVEKAQRLWGVE